MIRLYQISKINNENYYSYVFDKNYGNGYFCGSLNKKGDGYGNGYRFGFKDGNGDSLFLNYLIEDYKTS